jgi:cell shape-determining protein MreC
VIALVLMALDHRFNQLQTLRSVFATIAYPLQLAVDAPIRAGSRILESFSRHEQLVLENRLLRSDLMELRARQLRFDALQAETTVCARCFTHRRRPPRGSRSPNCWRWIWTPSDSRS